MIGTAGAGEFQPVHSSGQRETGTLDLQLPSAKTIRKYVIWTTDSAFYTYTFDDVYGLRSDVTV